MRPNTFQGREFYIPHKGVVRETAESTKLRIVYDASARAWDSAPSLNECLNTGPPLQNKLWSVLVRGRFNPVCADFVLYCLAREDDFPSMGDQFHTILLRSYAAAP